MRVLCCCMKGVSQTLKMWCKFLQIAQKPNNLQDNMKLNSWGASLQAQPGAYSFHLKISTGPSISVVATRIHEWWGSRSCSFWTSVFGYVLTVCSASQPGNRLYLVAATVSLALSICSGVSAETVCKHLPLGSFPPLGPNLVCQLFVTDCLRRGKMESSPSSVFTLCVCVCTHTRRVEGLNSQRQVRSKYKESHWIDGGQAGWKHPDSCSGAFVESGVSWKEKSISPNLEQMWNLPWLCRR